MLENNIDLTKLQRLKDDLPYFAEKFLIIKTKNEGHIKFKFTNIQYDAHCKIQERKKLPSAVLPIGVARENTL